MACKPHRSRLRRACGVVREERGVIAVEFALTAPLMLLIMLATMAFALHYAIMAWVIYAASEGARASVSGLTDADRTAAATARATAVLQAFGPLIPIDHATVNTVPNDANSLFQVSVSFDPGLYDINSFYRLWSAFDGQNHAYSGTITYTATAGYGGYGGG